MRWLDGIIDSVDNNREAGCAAVHGITESNVTEQVNNAMYMYN